MCFVQCTKAWLWRLHLGLYYIVRKSGASLPFFFFLIYILDERLRMWSCIDIWYQVVRSKWSRQAPYIMWFGLHQKKKKKKGSWQTSSCQKWVSNYPMSISMNVPLTWTNHVESATHYICNILERLERISVILYFHFLTQFSLLVWSWGFDVLLSK